MARKKAQDVFKEISDGSRQVIANIQAIQTEIQTLKRQLGTTTKTSDFSTLASSVQKLNTELNTTKTRMAEVAAQYNSLRNLPQYAGKVNPATKSIASMGVQQGLAEDSLRDVAKSVNLGSNNTLQAKLRNYTNRLARELGVVEDKVISELEAKLNAAVSTAQGALKTQADSEARVAAIASPNRLQPVGTVVRRGVPGGHPDQSAVGAALDPAKATAYAGQMAVIGKIFSGLNLDATVVNKMSESIAALLRAQYGDAFGLKDAKASVKEVIDGIYEIRNLQVTPDGDFAKAEKPFSGPINITQNGQVLGKPGGGISQTQIENLERENVGMKAALENIENMTGGKYGRNNLKSITQGDPKNQRSRLVFEDVDLMTGAVSRLDTTVDKFGQVTVNTGYEFRSFAQGVAHDIGRLMMWTIAISAIYAPLQKLNDLKEHMIQTETKLAQASVAMAGSHENMSEVFDRLYVSASRAGEGLEMTVDAFKTSYRAVGGEGSEFERFDNSIKLLDSGLTLAQLSTLDEAKAIDTLAAALNQVGKGFDHGTALLNEWVRVTKVANVDLATLATGFAVLGEAAENSGISSSQLSAMVAVISENTPYEGTQVANIAKSVVSGFQSDKAVTELNRLGIAVKDTEGNFRSLHDLMMEIYSMRNAGLISDTDFASLTRAIGGGARRQAPTAALINNYSRVSQIEQLAKLASPTEAEDALKLQLDTVEVGAQRLDNAFQNLSMTLGEEGGMLRGFKDLLSLGTGLVDMLNALMEITGKVGPTLLTLGAAAGFAFSMSPEWRAGMKDNVRDVLGAPGFYKGRMEGRIGATETSQYGKDQPTTWRGRGHESQLAMNLMGEGKGIAANITSSVATGLAMAIIPAISNVRAQMSGDDDYGYAKAFGNVGGAIGGAMISTMLGGGPAIGAIIGTSAGDFFIGRTQHLFDPGGGVDYKGFANEGDAKEVGEGLYNTDAFEKAQRDLFIAATGAPNIQIAEAMLKDDFLGKTGQINSSIEYLNTKIDSGEDFKNEEEYNRWVFTGRNIGRKTMEGMGFTYEQFQKNLAAGKKFDPLTPTQVALQLATDRGETGAVENYKNERDIALSAGKVPGEKTFFSQQTLDFSKVYEEEIKRLEEGFVRDIKDDRKSGDITGAKYRENMGNVLGAGTEKVPSTALAFKDEFMELRPDVEDLTDVFRALFEVFAFGSKEAIAEINEIKGEIADLENDLSVASATEFKLSTGAIVDREGAEDYLAASRVAGAALIDKTQRQAMLGRADFSPIRNDITQPYSREVTDELLQRTQDTQRKYYSEISPEIPIEVIEDSFEAFALYLEEGGKELYEKFTGYDPQFLAIEQKKMEEEGKIGDKGRNMGFQQVDLDSSRRPELDAWLKHYEELLTKSGYKLDPQETALMYNDENIDILHTDNIQLKLALEKLIDIGQKQLDGMYNIPDGATFWVPLQAAYYGKGGKDSGSMLGSDVKKEDEVPEVFPEWDLKHKGFDDLLEYDLINRPIGPESALDTKPERLPISPEEMTEGWYRTLLEMEDNDSKYLTEKLAETQDDRKIEKESGSWIEGLLKALMDTKPNFGDTSKDVLDMLFKMFPTQTSPINPNSSIGPTQAPEVTSNLNINLNTTTSLQVDGRALATVMKTYLMQDMVRTQASQSRGDINLIV